MASKPFIGINADFRSAQKDFPAFSFLSAGYYDALTKAGAVPVVIPPLTDEDDLARVLDVLDGVVLAAGPTSTRVSTASWSIPRSASWIAAARSSTAC